MAGWLDPIIDFDDNDLWWDEADDDRGIWIEPDDDEDEDVDTVIYAQSTWGCLDCNVVLVEDELTPDFTCPDCDSPVLRMAA